MRELTAREAVAITKELWTYLAETGAELKKDWSGWEKYGKMLCDCPLCEYDYQQAPSPLGCPCCPLLNQWEGKRRCPDAGSPWRDWTEANFEGRKAAAQRIVALCDKWLEEHKEEVKHESA